MVMAQRCFLSLYKYMKVWGVYLQVTSDGLILNNHGARGLHRKRPWEINPCHNTAPDGKKIFTKHEPPQKKILTECFVLQCMFIPTLTSEQQTCLDVEYLSEKGICCNRCFQGNVWTKSQLHVHWLCDTSYYTNCNSFFFKLNSVVPLEFVFQVISLQRSAPLRVGEVNASPVSMANTRIQLTSLPTAENAKAAKVQYSGLYPNKSGSPVWFAVVECQSAVLLCSFLFPQHQGSKWWFRHVKGPRTPFVAARTVITSICSIRKTTHATDAKPVN